MRRLLSIHEAAEAETNEAADFYDKGSGACFAVRRG